MKLETWYIPEGETHHLTVVGLRVGNEESEPLVCVDGTALLMVVEVEEAEHDGPVLLKQFGASDLLLAGLSPATLDPGQEVEVRRYEGGGYEVSMGTVEDASDAM